MRRRAEAIVAITLVILAPASSAVAAITCGMPVQTSPGVVEMTVTSDQSFAVVGDSTVGNVTLDPGTCTSSALTFCTWSGSGDPGGTLPQSASLSFMDLDGTVECTMTDEDGLPVELVEFSVD